MVLRIASFIAIAALVANVAAAGPHSGSGPVPTPENHVYQYMTTQTYTVPKFETPPGVPAGFLFAPQTSTGYLWIPPACKHVRGVVVLGHNVPEQGLGGHPAIRQVCAELDLVILFTCPSFRLARSTSRTLAF